MMEDLEFYENEITQRFSKILLDSGWNSKFIYFEMIDMDDGFKSIRKNRIFDSNNYKLKWNELRGKGQPWINYCPVGLYLNDLAIQIEFKTINANETYINKTQVLISGFPIKGTITNGQFDKTFKIMLLENCTIVDD